MQNKTTNIRKLTGTAMLGAVAAVLMYMEFPIPIMPSFVKLDVSELPRCWPPTPTGGVRHRRVPDQKPYQAAQHQHCCGG